MHPTAIVAPGAQLGEDVVVGPHAIVEAGVKIGVGTRLGAGTYICTGTTIGCENIIHMHAIIGNEPQDWHYDGAETFVEIGDRNVIREFVTIHRGSQAGTGTRIGSGNSLMATSHVAHNCVIGDGAVIANGALLAGHVEIGSGAFISGNALMHQFIRIGRLAMVAGGARVTRDVPPFCLMEGESRLRGLNRVGMRRSGLSKEAMSEIGRAYRAIFMRRSRADLAAKKLLAADPADGAREMVEFVLASFEQGRRGVCAHKRGRHTNR
ncbi:MAG: acyl-ACP--UDP-N-acetylglucosamine O-acyltransferase [Planctomycetota bacterium]